MSVPIQGHPDPQLVEADGRVPFIFHYPQKKYGVWRLKIV
jgi:hypothetical protein